MHPPHCLFLPYMNTLFFKQSLYLSLSPGDQLLLFLDILLHIQEGYYDNQDSMCHDLESQEKECSYSFMGKHALS